MKKNHHHSEKTKRKISVGVKNAIHKPNCNCFICKPIKRAWNKGKIIKFGMWKGDKVKNCALHAWIRRHKPQPEYCAFCGEKVSGVIDLANIKGHVYTRAIEDYVYMHHACHLRYDYLHNDRGKKISKKLKGKPKTKMHRLHIKEGWKKRR